MILHSQTEDNHQCRTQSSKFGNPAAVTSLSRSSTPTNKKVQHTHRHTVTEVEVEITLGRGVCGEEIGN